MKANNLLVLLNRFRFSKLWNSKTLTGTWLKVVTSICSGGANLGGFNCDLRFINLELGPFLNWGVKNKSSVILKFLSYFCFFSFHEIFVVYFCPPLWVSRIFQNSSNHNKKHQNFKFHEFLIWISCNSEW